MKADLERELETWSLNCTKCGLDGVATELGELVREQHAILCQ